MITERRASELALLCCEAALRHRAPNGGSPPADLAEWIAGHAQVAPELAALPEVARLLRSWPGRYAEAHVAAAAAAGPGSDRVDTGALPVVLTTREAAGRLRVTDRGIRWMCSRGRLPGSHHDRITGAWVIPAATVAAYAGARPARAS